MSGEQHRHTVLMVGQGEPMQTALGEALRRHGVSVAGCATAELERAVRVYAPDLVVLIGDAAVRGGISVVRRMASNPATDVIPVAVISNDAVQKHEGQDFRSGAVAIVPRASGADSIARRLSELATEVPDRSGLVSGRISRDNLQEVVDLVSNDMKTGILSIRSPAGPVEGMPVIIETERPSAHNMELILERLREAVTGTETLEYEFHETSGGRLSSLNRTTGTSEIDVTQLQGVRLVILDSDELRAEKLAHLLAARGLQIAAADFSAAVIPRVREIDPQIVVMDSAAVGGKGMEFVRAMRKDPQLRWASMLVVRWEDYWSKSPDDAEPDIAQLTSRILPLVEQDLEISRRVEDEVDFDTRLELVGPGRLIRALGSVPGVRHVSVAGNKRDVEIDIADNSVLGAYSTLRDDPSGALQGVPALLSLWELNAARVSVREQDLPSVANIMMPIDEALGVVAHKLGFPDGPNDVEVNAATLPPAAAAHRTKPTAPDMEIQLDDLDAIRVDAPTAVPEPAPVELPFMQAAVGSDAPGGFPPEEAPTHKVAKPLGRVSPKRQKKATGAAHEAVAEASHVDHGVRRKPKATKMGLGAVFEVLPDDSALDAQMTIPVPREQDHKTIPIPGRQPTPPPPPVESRKPVPTPLFEADDELEPQLARVLEGPLTVLAPGTGGGGLPAWIQVLLLVTVLAGLGVLGWQLWARSGSSEGVAVEAEPELEAEGAKGPITGTVNGLEAEAAEARSEVAEPAEEESDAPEMAFAEQEVELPEVSHPGLQPPPPSKTTPPKVSTRGLPEDPAKASDILVHRSIPMIRRGELVLAEATLDRAWELDAKNPQAMAGYARLYVAKKDGERAETWALRALKKRSRRPQYHVLYGDALALQGRDEEAERAWRKALSLDPENRAAKTRLAEAGSRTSN